MNSSKMLCGFLVGLALVLGVLAAEADAADDPADSPPKLVIEAQGFTAMVNALDFSPRGDLLAAAGTDKVVRVWEVASGKLRATLRGYNGKGSEGYCQAVAFSPDGRHLLVGVQDFTDEGAIRVYDVAKLDEIESLLPGHSNRGVRSLAFSGDGRFLASTEAGAESEVIVWSWPERRQIGRVRVRGEVYYVGFPSRLPMLVAFDSDGFHAWSAVRAKDLRQLTAAEWAEVGPVADVRAAMGEAEAMGRVLSTIAFPNQGRVNSTRVYPAAGVAVIGIHGKRAGRDAYWVGTWSTRDGRSLRLYDGHRFIPSAEALTADGTLAASADVLGEVHVWDTRTGETRQRFTAKGRPVYKVGFADSGQKLAFGTRRFGPDRWGYNSYADLDQTFDLAQRRLDEGAPGAHMTEVNRLGDRSLTLSAESGRFTVTTSSGGRVESRYPLQTGIWPQCYSFLRSKKPGFPDPVVLGKNDNGLTIYDPRNMLARREFIGHEGAINAVGESPDGLLMVSGSDDRTIRLWSLSGLRQDALPDFDSGTDSSVTYLIPGGFAQRAGILPGDVFRRMDGREVGPLMDDYLSGRWPYRVGQKVKFDMERGGRPYQVVAPLAATGDFTDPVLSLFITDDEWVIWSPQGYYDASPRGAELIGWHVNRGRSKSAKFYLAEQFRKQFYRPDVINRILTTGNPDRAIAEANAARPRPPEPLDLRKPGVLTSMEPPVVKLTEPADGTCTKATSITVSGRVESTNERPVGEVTILVNGRPVSGKSLGRGAGDTDRRRTIDQEVPLFHGLNTISVLSTNGVARSRTTSVRVFCDSTAKAGPKNVHVLAVGISRYARPDFELKFAHRDALSFARAWKTQAGGLYADVFTRVLTDAEATAANIREGMDWLRERVTANDLAVLFFSAHGLEDQDGGFFVATHEIDPRRLMATAIPNTDIIRFVAGLRCKVMVFVDTCHAGGMLHVSGSREDAFHDLTSDQVGAVMFASSTPGGLSQELEQYRHGAFTKAILETLADRKCYDNDLLTTFDMPSQLDRRVRKFTENRQQPVVKFPERVPSFPFFKFAEGIEAFSLHVPRSTVAP